MRIKKIKNAVKKSFFYINIEMEIVIIISKEKNFPYIFFT